MIIHWIYLPAQDSSHHQTKLHFQEGICMKPVFATGTVRVSDGSKLFSVFNCNLFVAKVICICDP